MGRKKLVETLKVYLNENLVGHLKKETDGAIIFQYVEDWISNGYSISLSLPLADRIFKGSKASFYFDNLLPDNEKILNVIAEKFKAESIRQFDILHAIGKECVGALSFFDEKIQPDFDKKISVKILTPEQIAKKIQGLSTENPLGMDDGDFRLSLGGAQEKMALIKRKDKWGEPRGMTPTTHIFKKPMGILLGGIDFTKSVDNEFICLNLADHFGIHACKASIENFADERVLCVERFDRVWKEDRLLRIPQEDFCQAMGQSPKLKYERDGGPSIKQMMTLLVTSNNAKEDRKTFFKTCLFNDLIFNTDAHAKNFSLFVVKGGFVLTPMYDLLSAHFILPRNPTRYESLRSSLSVNSKFYFNQITKEDWAIEANKCELPNEIFNEIKEELKVGVADLAAFKNKFKDAVNEEHLDLILEGMTRRAAIILAH